MKNCTEPGLYDLNSYDYKLPEELIAQQPLADRSQSRLLVVSGRNRFADDRVVNVGDYLRAGDLMVTNDSRVRHARVRARRQGGGISEVLFVRQLSSCHWRVLLRPARRSRVGDRLSLPAGVVAEVTAVEDDGCRVVRLDDLPADLDTYLQRWGEVPLPPYIRGRLADSERYQTVYGRQIGSVAAPTAGLHFTVDLLDKIRRRGVDVVSVTLHVGPGTFRPVSEQDIRCHRMHGEEFSVEERTMEILSAAVADGRRVVAVGTTAARVLETLARENFTRCRGTTGLFIYPGFKWRMVGGLLTNFHLPRSSLLMMVSALAGLGTVKEAYRHAIERKYRFYSFGDAMLVWRQPAGQDAHVG
ncbi:MAG: tRNA preQ1(34) S-adenosylmethionine ribosyltransferase-isomerase QueA [Negativicutes bacterium]|nr:tRNA preQ1(34) S-adenosylmethionine ribosyltransferase-isomerase QueA [Negativicutes bacterium]